MLFISSFKFGFLNHDLCRMRALIEFFNNLESWYKYRYLYGKHGVALLLVNYKYQAVMTSLSGSHNGDSGSSSETLSTR